jgi:hypothetical protein
MRYEYHNTETGETKVIYADNHESSFAGLLECESFKKIVRSTTYDYIAKWLRAWKLVSFM